MNQSIRQTDKCDSLCILFHRTFEYPDSFKRVNDQITKCIRQSDPIDSWWENENITISFKDSLTGTLQARDSSFEWKKEQLAYTIPDGNTEAHYGSKWHIGRGSVFIRTQSSRHNTIKFQIEQIDSYGCASQDAMRRGTADDLVHTYTVLESKTERWVKTDCSQICEMCEIQQKELRTDDGRFARRKS